MTRKHLALLVVTSVTLLSLACGGADLSGKPTAPTSGWSTMLIRLEKSTPFWIKDIKGGNGTAVLTSCEDLLAGEQVPPGNCTVTWSSPGGYGLECQGSDTYYNVTAAKGTLVTLAE